MLKDKEKIIFIHIPKTGGTTLRSILEKKFKNEFININPDTPFSSYDKELLLKNFQIIKGHFQFGNIVPPKQEQENYKFVTFLREPVDLIISHYYFFKDKNVYRKEIESIVNFAKENDIKKYSSCILDNFMTRFLAGTDKDLIDKYGYIRLQEKVINGELKLKKINESDYKKAIDNIDNRIDFIGLIELFDESLILSGLDYPYKKRNCRLNKKCCINEISNEDKLFLKQHNEFDIKIYDYCKQELIKKIKQQNNFLFYFKIAKIKISKLFLNFVNTVA